MRDISNEPKEFQLFCWMVHKIYQSEVNYVNTSDEAKQRQRQTYDILMKTIKDEHPP